MGNKTSSAAPSVLEGAPQSRLEARCGKIPLSGRYHKSSEKKKTIDDDYEVSAKILGSGYNGVVRQATAKAHPDGDKYAVKAFNLSNVADNKKEDLIAEVEIFLVMDHPHITRLYDVYENEEYLYLVMECMEGGELFDRVTQCTQFTERDASDATWHMLLALNYLHSHGIVHRDIKLENFLYDSKGSNQLKLIDFGFSKMWDANSKMQASCGTLAYVAPEVLNRDYTSQCDLWSLGVVAFILLAGYMPFFGNEATQSKHIKEGKYTMKPERWDTISQEAHDFVKSLLTVDPEKRLSAQAALDHPWISNRFARQVTVDEGVASALRQFGQASKFRRCCMEMMAWSLSNEERAKVRDEFISIDRNKHGTITLGELKKVLSDKFSIEDEEVLKIFNAMDSNNDQEIHYSDFLAAMVNTRIALHDDLLHAAFKKFDTDSSGYITKDNLRQVLGDTFEGEKVDKLLAEGDLLKDGRISFPEFVAYIRETPLDDQICKNQVKDSQLKQYAASGMSFFKGAILMTRTPSRQGSKQSAAGARYDADTVRTSDVTKPDSPVLNASSTAADSQATSGKVSKRSDPKCCLVQ